MPELSQSRTLGVATARAVIAGGIAVQGNQPIGEPTWKRYFDAKNERYALADREAELEEAKAKQRARTGRILFWFGLSPFILFAALTWHSATWLDGYEDGWRAGAAGEPLGETQDAIN